MTLTKTKAVRESAFVLEDEVRPARKICETLDSMGIECNWAAEINKAEAVVESNQVLDYLFVDVHIDHDTPLKVINQARKFQPGIVIVGFTGYPMSKSVREVKDACDYFLERKPISIKIARDQELRTQLDRFTAINQRLLSTRYKARQKRKLPSSSYPIRPGSVRSENTLDKTAFENSKVELITEHLDEYVGIVDGEIKVIHADKAKVLATLRKRFPNKPKYIKRIQKESRIAHIPNLYVKRK